MATKERLIIESMFNIADKSGRDVPFMLNDSQRRLDDELSGRDIIPKARQEGISSYYLARWTALCLSQRNVRAVVISHDALSTQRMLKKVHYFLENLRGPKAVIKNASANEIVFGKTNSMFYIGTAGTKKFGRGDTITHLHCSEVAFWEQPLTLLTGLFQAVPKDGEIALESTGNGVGNYYHRTCMRAAIGQSRYRMHFFNWIEFSEYTLDLDQDQSDAIMSNLIEEFEEPELVEKYNLTAGQLAWRRDKLDELDYDLTQFKQEYPITLDECFQSGGRSLFTRVNYYETAEWKRQDFNYHYLEGHPNSNYTYCIGADVAGGIGGKSVEKNEKSDSDGDRSVAQIICIELMEQVGEWVSNKIEPDAFGRKLAAFGRLFHNAYIVVEANNHGILTINELLTSYDQSLVHRRSGGRKSEIVDRLATYGVRTTSKSKPYIIGELRRMLTYDLQVHSPVLKSELDTFIEKESGALGAVNGCFDDRVIALAMCNAGLEKAAMYVQSNRQEVAKLNQDPFSMEGIISELTDNRGGFPIASQTRH